MIEFILWATLTWWFIVPTALSTIWFMHEEHHWWAVFSVATLIAVSYNFFNIPIEYIGYGAIGYIPTGIAWSIFRWKRHCKKTFAVYDNENASESYKTAFRRQLNPKDQITRILTWVFLFPFSFIESIVGDIIDAVEDFIRKYLITIYNNISSKYTDQIK